jgi:hypothetical protein
MERTHPSRGNPRRHRPRPTRTPDHGPATVLPAKPSLAGFPADARWMVEAYGD